MTLVVCVETGPGVFRRLVRELLEFLKEMSVGKDALVAERGLGPRCQVCTLDSRPGARGGWVGGSAGASLSGEIGGGRARQALAVGCGVGCHCFLRKEHDPDLTMFGSQQMAHSGAEKTRSGFEII